MPTDEITGRDDFIIAHALFLAIKWIDSQPEETRETSNQDHMRAILMTRYPGEFRMIKDVEDLADNIQRAMRLGMKIDPQQRVDYPAVLAFLEHNKPKPV